MKGSDILSAMNSTAVLLRWNGYSTFTSLNSQFLVYLFVVVTVKSPKRVFVEITGQPSLSNHQLQW